MKDWLLERALLGELPPARIEQVERARGDDAIRARLDALRASNARILAELPPAAVVAEVERRLRLARIERDHERAHVARRLAWLGPIVAAAAAFLVFWLRTTGPVHETGERLKGEPRLEFHRQRGAVAERLRDGALVHAGDRLQVSYFAAGRRYGAILSIDGRGTVTFHYPDRAGEAGALEPSGTIALPFGYQLDDAPRFERFFFVTADGPFDLERVRFAATRLAADPERARYAPLALPPGLGQRAYSFHKGPTR